MGHLLGRGSQCSLQEGLSFSQLLAGPLGTATSVPPRAVPPSRGPCSALLTWTLISPFSRSSIVLVASKGRFITRGPWTRVLEKLGADKGLKLKGEGFVLGFMGPDAWGAGTPPWAEASSVPQT